MKVYTLIYEENSDNWCEADVSLFLNQKAAELAMEEAFQKAVKDLNLLVFKGAAITRPGKISLNCGDTYMTIKDDMDSYSWRIEEKDLPVEVAVHVSGGMAREIITNGEELAADVYDVDVSDPPDEAELEEADGRTEEYNYLKHTRLTHVVW